MLRNYIKIAWRNLHRNKSHALINILGLALGVICAVIIFQVIRFELSFDDFHASKDRIYRVVSNSIENGEENPTTGVAYPFYRAIQNDFPEIESMAIVEGAYASMVAVEDGRNPRKYKLDPFESDVSCYTTPAYFEMFDAKWLAGDPSILAMPGQVVLTETYAKTFFPNQQAFGQAIKVDNDKIFNVGGVVADAPANSDLPYIMFFSFASVEPDLDMENWGSVSSSTQCYLLLPDQATELTISERLPAFADKYLGDSQLDVRKDFSLQPLSDLHFNTTYENANFRSVSRKSIMVLALIGLVLIITAAINFINLATALAVKRSKEVGIRKVLGSEKKQLVFQFLGETFVIVFLAIILSGVLIQAFATQIESVLDINIAISILDLQSLTFLLGLTLFIVLLAGLYPAFILSGFQPVEAVKSKLSQERIGGLSLRRTLVVLQFCISQILIICTLVMMWQMDYFIDGPLGFNKEAIVYVDLPNNERDLLDPLKNRLSEISGVSDITFAFTTPASGSVGVTNFSIKGTDFPQTKYTQLKFGDENYHSLFGLNLIAGEGLLPSDTANRYLVNESLAREAGFHPPETIVGELLNTGGVEAPISGVIADFMTTSFHDPIGPVSICSGPKRYQLVALKLDTRDLKNTLSQVETAWSTIYPDYYFELEFLDQFIAETYEEEARISNLLKIFAGIAIFIGCLGLYGLISFMTAQKTKEVGIRKVLGASIGNIIYTFSKEFTVLVLIAFAIAVPVGYFAMKAWLAEFAYKIDLGLGVFVIAILSSILIAWVTVGYKSIRAALANPVEALKYE